MASFSPPARAHGLTLASFLLTERCRHAIRVLRRYDPVRIDQDIRLLRDPDLGPSLFVFLDLFSQLLLEPFALVPQLLLFRGCTGSGRLTGEQRGQHLQREVTRRGT